MAKNVQLPHASHLVRYCDPDFVEKDKILDDAFLIESDAFALGVGEKGLSVCCIEKIDDTFSLNKKNLDSLNEIMRGVRSQLATALKLKPNGRLALFNTGKAIKDAKKVRKLTVLHTPRTDYHSHSEVRGYTHQDTRIPRIIRRCIINTFSTTE